MIQRILLIAGSYLFEFISLMILINILLSWIRPNPNNIVIKFVYGLTEPILSPLRRFAVIGPIDFSAIVAIMILRWLIQPLYRLIIIGIF